MEPTRIDAEGVQAVTEAFETDVSIVRAREHNARAEAVISRVRAGECTQFDGAVLCVAEYDGAIALLSKALGTGEVLNLMAEVRERRASMLAIIIMHCLNTECESSDQIEARCRQMFIDSTVVIDVSNKRASADLVRKARHHRIKSVGFLNNSLRVPDIERQKKIALEDCRAILSDDQADEDSKAVASRAVSYLQDTVSSTMAMNEIESIKASFLTKADLSKVQGLNVGVRGHPTQYIAREYMDKAGPVKMNDGSPKDLPAGITSVRQIQTMSPRDLNSRFGLGAGTYFGEIVFWKRYNGIMLGKHKWESVGMLDSDHATLSELWDMRWLFASAKDAKDFHEAMLAACRQEDNNGYLDSMAELSLKPGERASLPDGMDRESIVFCGNSPKRRPTSDMGMAVMMADPTAYLQQYTIVFVVCCMVVKLYAIEGFNPLYGGLKRSYMFGDTGLVSVATKVVKEWFCGSRVSFDLGQGAAAQSASIPELGDLSKCANCGKKPQVLKTCARCQLAAYCDRDCQLAHYKMHKKPCKNSVRGA